MVIPSRARVGRANVTWLNEAQHKIAEYETEATLLCRRRGRRRADLLRRLPLLRAEPGHRPACPAAGKARRSVGPCRLRPAGERLLSEGRQPAHRDRGEETGEPETTRRAHRRAPGGIDRLSRRHPRGPGRLVRPCHHRQRRRGHPGRGAPRRPHRRGRHRRSHHRLRGRRRPGRGPRRLGLPALRPAGREEAGRGGHPRPSTTWR